MFTLQIYHRDMDDVLLLFHGVVSVPTWQTYLEMNEVSSCVWSTLFFVWSV